MSDNYVVIALAILLFLATCLMMAGYQLKQGRTREAGSILLLTSSMALAAVISLAWAILV
ncbi:MAG: hypothetical protein KDA17_03400 [Candidatus Saccharibacteria bacterium]|nr:hypothetical protein [Candidatus Saccharibacteria bacterium]MCA9339931.1 hypothetical protein [Candidatus Saccharibacteria bacterium]